MEDRNYAFNWGMVGDVELGRPNLGALVRVEAYRLIACAFRDMLEEEFGTARCEVLFKEVGKKAGKSFYELCCGFVSTFEDFTESLVYSFRYMGLGVLEVKPVGNGAWSFVVTVYEDLSRSGIEHSGDEICYHHEGFLAGMFEAYAHMEFDVRTLHCWTNADRACRFSVEAVIPAS